MTRDSVGRHVPKQFCRFGGDDSLLRHTLGRATCLAPPDRILVVVQEAHRRWWQSELSCHVQDANIIVQPTNSGTAVAVLHAVSRALERDRDPHLLVLPSDHGVDDEHAWHHTLTGATDVALRWPEQVVLVGVDTQIDPDLGWIVPGRPAADGSHSVLGFVEKPDWIEAANLIRQGALCSTFAFASSAGALLSLFGRHASDLVTRYALAFGGPTRSRVRPLESLPALPVWDFSRDLLQRAPQDVRVLPGLPCGWTDLGTPARLERWLERRLKSTAKADVFHHELMVAS